MEAGGGRGIVVGHAGKTGSTWPGVYVRAGYRLALAATGIGVFTYIESLPTYNYRLPILPRARARPAMPPCQIHEARVMLGGSA